jgi:hypothetical protein
MMKKFLKNILIFTLVFFVVDKLFYWKIESLPKRELDKRLEWILEGKMNKDILIFGSSRAQHNLYADAIQDSLKETTFNLGYRGSTINFQLFILKKVLKHNTKPKKILLTTDDSSEFLIDKTLQFRYDKLYSLVKYQEITADLIVRKELSPFAYLLYSARLGWKQFSGTKPPDKFDQWTAAGTVLLEESTVGFENKKKTSRKYIVNKEVLERLTAFDEFQKICQENAIELFVLIPPNFSNINKGFVDRVEDLIRDKKSNFYYEDTIHSMSSENFYDESHLNKQGAVLYTNKIIKKMKEAALENSKTF